MTGRKDCKMFEDLLTGKMIENENLTGEEKQILERHQLECVDCAMDFALLNHLGGGADRIPVLSEGEASMELTIRQDVLRAENRSKKKRRSSRNRVFAGALIATAAAAASLLIFPLGTQKSSTHLPVPEDPSTLVENKDPAVDITLKRVDGQVRFLNRPPSQGDQAHEGDVIEVYDGSVLLEIGNGSAVIAEQNAKLNLIKANTAIIRLGLDSGKAVFKVEELGAEQQVIVDFPGGQIRVLGTLFSVDLGGGKIDLHVAEGVVYYKTADGDSQTVQAGEALGAEGQIRKLDDLEIADLKRIFDGPSENELIESHKIGVAPEFRRELEEKPSRHLSRKPPPEVKPEKEIEQVPIDSVEPAAVTTIAELMSRAAQLRAEAQWADLIEVYKDVVLHYPSSAEAQTCLVLMGNVQLKQLRNYIGALKSYKGYLARSPNGALSEEADWGVAMAYRKLELHKKERAALERFSKRYPASPFAPVVKERLAYLAEYLKK